MQLLIRQIKNLISQCESSYHELGIEFFIFATPQAIQHQQSVVCVHSGVAYNV